MSPTDFVAVIWLGLVIAAAFDWSWREGRSRAQQDHDRSSRQP